MTDYRIEKIFDAAGRLFINPGYNQTQVDHIVKACGISVGALYDLFTGKKAILKFILTCIIEPDYINRDISLPIDEEQFIGLEQEIIAFFSIRNSDFTSHLSNVNKDYTFDKMLADAYDNIASYGMGLLILEKNPSALPKLFSVYKDYRKQFFSGIVSYMAAYAKQGVIKLAYPVEFAAIFIVETMIWWAVDMRYDAFEPRNDIPRETARSFCIDTLQSAFGYSAEK